MHHHTITMHNSKISHKIIHYHCNPIRCKRIIMLRPLTQPITLIISIHPINFKCNTNKRNNLQQILKVASKCISNSSKHTLHKLPVWERIIKESSTVQQLLISTALTICLCNQQQRSSKICSVAKKQFNRMYESYNRRCEMHFKDIFSFILVIQYCAITRHKWFNEQYNTTATKSHWLLSK